MTNHIKESLTHLLNINEDWRFKVVSEWDTIMGNLCDKVRLEKIINTNVLVLGVFDASWMQELYLLSPMLIKTINNHLKHPHVKEIRFKAAAKKRKNIRKTTVVVQTTPLAPVTLSAQERIALEKISDPQLRSILQDYLAYCNQE